MHHLYRNPTLPPPHVLRALRSGVSDMLTPEEIATLKQRAKERSAFFQKAFARLWPKPGSKSLPRAAELSACARSGAGRAAYRLHFLTRGRGY